MATEWVSVDKPDLDSPPTRVTPVRASRSFWVGVSSDGPFAFLDECAHMGGELALTSSGMRCPSHGWTYSWQGLNDIKSGPRLRQLKVRQTARGTLEVLVPVRSEEEDEIPRTPVIGNDLEIRAHAHAALELVYGGVSVLFDPWLAGPAYYGSWYLHPKPRVRAEDLEPSVVLISHPHPDHFHIPTLERLDRDIPLYFPAFPSRIIERALDKLGFRNSRSVLWGESIQLSESISFSFLRPRSMWEDSAVLLQVKDSTTDFVWLNQVDAGAPLLDDDPPFVDLLSSAFDQGASGYPLTWTSMSEGRRRNILRNAKVATLNSIAARMTGLSARWFLPFAGHWRLGRPEHQVFAEMIPHTNYSEVQRLLEKRVPSSELIDIYPGETVEMRSMSYLHCSAVREEVSVGFAPQAASNQMLEPHAIPEEDRFTQSEQAHFHHFMEGLVRQGWILDVERVDFTVLALDASFEETYRFSGPSADDSAPTLIEVSLPQGILRMLGQGLANWDHVQIGYWGTWRREPDAYTPRFMRLLQSGHVPEYMSSVEPPDALTDVLQIPVAHLVESTPDLGARLLSRLGLPCFACSRSSAETLGEALTLHGIDIDSTRWVLDEIRAISLGSTT